MSDDNTAISSRFLTDDKKRGLARSYFSRIVPLTGNNALPNQNIRFSLPNNRAGTYIDGEHSFIRYKVKTECAAQTHLTVVGCGGFVKSAILRSSGSYLSQIDNYATYRALHVRSSHPLNYLIGDGAVMSGTKDATTGCTVKAGSARTFVDPLSNFGSVFASNRYIPCFSASPLELELLLAGATDNFLYNELTDYLAHAMLGNSGISFSEIELVLAMVEVSAEIDQQILIQHNNLFKYLCNNTGSFSSNILSGARQHTFNLGISYTSVNKIDIVFVSNSDTSDLTKFTKGGVSKVNLMIDGVSQVISGGMDVLENSIAIAYMRSAQHALSDTSVTSHATDETFENNCFIVSIDLESLTGKSESLRSGRNTGSSTTQVQVEFAAGATSDLTMHTFVSYDAMVSLDLMGSRQYEVSV
jgi:hypothetical protein